MNVGRFGLGHFLQGPVLSDGYVLRSVAAESLPHNHQITINISKQRPLYLCRAFSFSSQMESFECLYHALAL
jgi:hypothetical protein